MAKYKQRTMQARFIPMLGLGTFIEETYNYGNKFRVRHIFLISVKISIYTLY